MAQPAGQTGEHRPPTAAPLYSQQQRDESHEQQRPQFTATGKRQPQTQTGERRQEKGVGEKHRHVFSWSSDILLIRTIFSCRASALLASNRKPFMVTTSPTTASRPRTWIISPPTDS